MKKDKQQPEKIKSALDKSGYPHYNFLNEMGTTSTDPLSNETKALGSLEQAAYEYELLSSGLGSATDDFKAGANWQISQIKNTDALKVITDRIAELEKQKIAVNEYAIAVGITSGMISELNHILKLIQP